MKKETNDIWNRVFKKNPNIVYRCVGSESILVPIRNNVGDLESIYTLNETGVRIWELIDGIRNIEQIKDTILDEFKVVPLEAEKDLEEFLAKLSKLNAIEEV